MARALEANGATVYIIGRRKHRLESVAKEAVSSLHKLQYSTALKEKTKPTPALQLTDPKGVRKAHPNPRRHHLKR